MKKIISVFLLTFIFISPLPNAFAASTIIKITSTVHQNFTGEFRNDVLSEELLPGGKLGRLIFGPINKSRTWVIDAALIDEVIAMTGEYKLANGATPTGSQVAIDWLAQLRKVTLSDEVVALAYGNPDIALAKRLAPSELRMYYAFSKTQLQSALGREVKSDSRGLQSIGKSRLSPTLQKNYSDSRRAITYLSHSVPIPEIFKLRARLGQLLSARLNKEERDYFSTNARISVDDQIHRLRINTSRYQITTERSDLPLTVINEFPIALTVDIDLKAQNSRITIKSFKKVGLPANSKTQLSLKVEVRAPGQTLVFASIKDDRGIALVPSVPLQLNATVIDPKLTWFTTGAAIILLLAAIAQSVRRARRGRKIEI